MMKNWIGVSPDEETGEQGKKESQIVRCDQGARYEQREVAESPKRKADSAAFSE